MRVYKYGLLPPIENAALVREQMRLAHRYRNTLVEIERGRRNAVRALYAEQEAVTLAKAHLGNTKSKLDAAIREVRAIRAANRSRAEGEELRAAVAALREELKVARVKLVEVRRAARIELTGKIKEIDARATELRNNFRNLGSGLYWGTYQLCDAADDASRKQTLFDFRSGEPNDPEFRKFSPSGQIGVQIQKGMTVAELFESNTLLHIAPVDERAWCHVTTKRGDRRRLARTELWFRVSSDEKRRAVWAKFPMIMHRPIPPQGIVKRATVTLRHIGPRPRWTLEIYVDDEAIARVGSGHGVVAVDVGWRKLGDEVRYGFWRSEAEHGECRLEPRVLSSLQKASDLVSIRDKNRNAMQPVLAEWLKSNPLPSWLKEATGHFSQWRSPRRFYSLARKWKERLAEHPETKTGYDILETWRYHDYHLWHWETSQREKSLGWRREVFRRFAAMLARRYDTLVLEKFDLRVFARRRGAREDELSQHENEQARTYRQLAAVSQFRDVLVNAFGRRGGKVVIVPAHYTTQACHVCSHNDHFDAENELNHVCSSCGSTWDQDDNASHNLLRIYREQSTAGHDPASSRESEKPAKYKGKFQRAKERKLAS